MKTVFVFLLASGFCTALFAGVPGMAGLSKQQIPRTPPKTYRYHGMLWVTQFHTFHAVDPTETESPPPGLSPITRHVQDFFRMDWRFGASYGFTDQWDLVGILPLPLVFETVRYFAQDGSEITGFNSQFHSSKYRLGFGDLEITSRVHLQLLEPEETFHLMLVAGFTLPLGAKEPRPSQELFFGTGSWDPLLGFEIRKSFGATPLLLAFYSRLPLEKNRDGYLPSQQFSLSAGIEAELFLPQLRFAPNLSYYHETGAKWGNELNQNTGRTDITPGIVFHWKKEKYLISTTLDFPFRLDSVFSTVTAPFSLYVSFTYLPAV